MIARETYMIPLRKVKNKKIIKVVTGIRRCGKSTLLEILRNEIQANGVQKSNTIYINLEDMEFSDILSPEKFNDYILGKIHEDKMNYLFIDEVQLLNGFERVINSLYLRDDIDIYLTGSNAYLLSGELATLLSGRYIEIPVMLLSFKEYLTFTKNKDTPQEKYYNYQRFSSFPYVAAEIGNDMEVVKVYLDGIYNTVILKDIVARRNIADVMMLESVIRFMFDNIGCMLSTKKIADTLTSYGRKIAVGTVESYVKGLLDSYIMYQAKRYDARGRQHLKTNGKYYIADIGLRYNLLGSSHVDEGRILENIVYLELRNRGYDVYVGKVDEYEIDFVAMKSSVIEYYQVALTVKDPETLARELRPFKLLKDHYPKTLITEDTGLETDYDGIKKVNILDFLTENTSSVL